MSAAHTPGPWEVDIRTRPKGHPLSIVKFNGPAFTELAYVPHHGKFSDANARIIAAAPRMLEALKALSRCEGRYYDTDQVTGETFERMVDAAIAEAEGTR